MKTIFILLLSCNFLFAYSVQEAFQNFYNDSSLSSRHCGLNIQHFLQYLEKENVPFKSGYVVSIHDDFAGVQHFDARWGSRETYLEGGEYFRSNWYFHVFLVVDGVAYDFSQRGAKTQSLQDYLEGSYIPVKTAKVFMAGKLNKKEVLKSFVNRKMKIYPIAAYRTHLGPALYSGSFIELYALSQGKGIRSPGKFNHQWKLSAQSKEIQDDGSISITYPQINIDSKDYYILAEPTKICRLFGYLGTNYGKMTFEVSDEVKIADMGVSFKITSPLNITENELLIYQDFRKTLGYAPNQPLFHYAKRVNCTDLVSTLSNLN